MKILLLNYNLPILFPNYVAGQEVTLAHKRFMGKVVDQHAQVAAAWHSSTRYRRTDEMDRYVLKLVSNGAVESKIWEMEMAIKAVVEEVMANNRWQMIKVVATRDSVDLRLEGDFRIFEWEQGRGKGSVSVSESKVSEFEKACDMPWGLNLPSNALMETKDRTVNIGTDSIVYAVEDLTVNVVGDNNELIEDVAVHKHEVFILIKGVFKIVTYDRYVKSIK